MKRSGRQAGNGCAVGIDLGRDALHVVTLDVEGATPQVAETGVVDPGDRDGLIGRCEGACAIAIDAPSELSGAPHAADMRLATKFRTARCGEIALGEQHRVWVPWTTPVSMLAAPPWMMVGFAAWAELRAAGHEPIEVFPYGVFRVLAGAPIPKKTTRAGIAARLAILDPQIVLPDHAELWSHDGLDALAGALVAAWRVDDRGRVVAARHTHAGNDGSAIWLPTSASALARP